MAHRSSSPWLIFRPAAFRLARQTTSLRAESGAAMSFKRRLSILLHSPASAHPLSFAASNPDKMCSAQSTSARRISAVSRGLHHLRFRLLVRIAAACSALRRLARQISGATSSAPPPPCPPLAPIAAASSEPQPSGSEILARISNAGRPLRYRRPDPIAVECSALPPSANESSAATFNAEQRRLFRPPGLIVAASSAPRRSAKGISPGTSSAAKSRQSLLSRQSQLSTMAAEEAQAAGAVSAPKKKSSASAKSGSTSKTKSAALKRAKKKTLS